LPVETTLPSVLAIGDVGTGSPKRVVAVAGEGANLFSQINAALSSMKPKRRDLAHCLIMDPAELLAWPTVLERMRTCFSTRTVIAEVASQPFSISISMAFTAMG
jgi:hypothetical protein